MLALSIWVFGYHILIRSFAALQRLEKLLTCVKRDRQALNRKT